MSEMTMNHKGTAPRRARAILRLDERRCKACGTAFQPKSGRALYCHGPDCPGARPTPRKVTVDESVQAHVEGLEPTLALLRAELLNSASGPASLQRITDRFEGMIGMYEDGETDCWLRGAVLQVAADLVEWAARLDGKER